MVELTVEQITDVAMDVAQSIRSGHRVRAGRGTSLIVAYVLQIIEERTSDVSPILFGATPEADEAMNRFTDRLVEIGQALDHSFMPPVGMTQGGMIRDRVLRMVLEELREYLTDAGNVQDIIKWVLTLL